MQNNNRKMFETLVSRTKIYLAIILVLVIIVGIENSKLIIPAIVLFLIVMGYTYYVIHILQITKEKVKYQKLYKI